jgi:hypothetical protein
MSDRNVEQELSEFFRRTAAPEPSSRLCEAVAAARLREPLARPATFRVGRTALSLMGLAATFVIAVSLLLIVVNRGQNGPAHPAAPCAGASDTSSPVAAATPSVDPSARGKFTPTGSMAYPRIQATATLLCDGRVLVVGGLGGNSAASLNDGSSWALASAELYDPATGKFSPTGSLAMGRMDHTATLLLDGRVLIAGGLGALATGTLGAEAYDPRTGKFSSPAPNNMPPVFGTTTLASAELYDPATGRFSPTGSMADTRYDDTATLLEDGRVLIAGGYYDGPTGSATPGRASAELYDPRTGEFSPTGALTTPRAGNTATLLPDGRVLIAGGIGADLYDPKTGSFSSTGSTVSRRYFHTATMLLDGRVLLAGGQGDGPALTSTELYDPETGRFTPTGSMALDRAHSTAALLPDGRVLIAGGGSSVSGNTATAELYDPATGAFRSAGSMSVARSWHTATSLRDGRVLIAGGQDYIDSSTWSLSGGADLYQP